MSDISIINLITDNYPQVEATAVRNTDQVSVSVSGSYAVAGADAASKQKDLKLQLLKNAKVALADKDAQSARDAGYEANRTDLEPLKSESITSPATPGDPSVSVSSTATLFKVTGATDTVTTTIRISLTDQDNVLLHNAMLDEGEEGFATQSYSVSLKKADNPGLDSATKVTATVTAFNEIDDASNDVTKTWEKSS